MTKYKIIGSIFDKSGYASHTRQFINELAKRVGVENVKLETQLFSGWESQCNDAEFTMINNKIGRDSTYIFIGQPPFWPIYLSERPNKFIGVCVFEGNKVPTGWMEYLLDDRVNEIWVPSIHVRGAILNTTITAEDLEYLNEKINIVPHGVNFDIFKPAEKPKDKFIFIAAKGWAKGINDRGGMQYVLKAFYEEFKDDPDVILKAHINTTYCQPGWNLLEETRKLGITEKTKNLYISTMPLSLKQMAELYNSGHAFVSASMAEGFNLPLAEAMACGLIPIYTNYGGHLDFCEGIGYPVDFEMVDSPEYEGVEWAKPSIDSLRKQMRNCYDDWKNKIEREERESQIEKFSWENTIKKALE